MPRSSPVPPQTPASPVPVPHTQALLQSALVASWKRDRRVGLRRLAWRWLVWGLWRCAALGLVVALVWTAWRWLMPETPAQSRGREPNPLAAQHASLARPAPPAVHEVPGATASSQDLSPKPDNRLHSKEP